MLFPHDAVVKEGRGEVHPLSCPDGTPSATGPCRLLGGHGPPRAEHCTPSLYAWARVQDGGSDLPGSGLVASWWLSIARTWECPGIISAPSTGERPHGRVDPNFASVTPGSSPAPSVLAIVTYKGS
jgi:hypothetical protein